jgi:hypothetical protein
MLIDLDDDTLDKLFTNSLLNTYRLLLEKPNNIRVFSMDVEEDKKKVGKLLKSVERVHDWYSATPLKQRLKSEEALKQLHAIDQELGLYESK